MAEQDSETHASTSRIPPYIAFATFLTFLRELKTNGLPPRIDKSVMSKMSGGQQSQMKLALKSLGLMEGDTPTPKLAHLVDAFDTDDFKPQLSQLLHATYPYVFDLDLMTATPAMFAEAFKVTGAKEDVLRKCRTFFLHAAKFVNVPLGQRLLTGSVPRSPSTGVRKKPRTKMKIVEPIREDEEDKQKKPSGVLGQLLEKFPDFDPNWPDPIKEKWFAGFDQFMKKAADQ
jgi:hypothetical protein